MGRVVARIFKGALLPAVMACVAQCRQDIGSMMQDSPKSAAGVPNSQPVPGSAGFILGTLSGNTTEGGGSATFTIALNSQPTAAVTLNLSSSNVAEGVVTPASLVFTSANWNIGQTVTVTGVDDLVADGNQIYTIIIGAAVSSDSSYNGLDPADLNILNLDNDAPNITVSAISGPTTEAGGTATFTLVLNTQPGFDVTINLTSSNTNEGTVSPGFVTFTNANWATPQTITATGVNDFGADGNVVYSIITAPALSSDPGYNGFNAADVTVTNNDDDSPGFTLGTISGPTTEAGGSATFTVVLNSQPNFDVNLGLSSSNIAEGTVSPTGLTFTNANWSTPQTVTVTGVDDSSVDGNAIYSIVTAAATSADLAYNGLNPPDVSVTNNDNDTAGFTIGAISGATTEAGGTATFTVVLTSQPGFDVSLGLSSSNTAEGTVSPSSLVFTNANWNSPQTVTVTGVDDFIVDGNVGYSILTAAAASSDINYNGLNPADVAITNNDNDIAGITVSAISGVTTEAGGQASFTIVLTSQPTADVTIGLSSSNTAEGTVSPLSVTFTNANWSSVQTVTVTGVDDASIDGNVSYSIITAAATSTDTNYNNLNAADISVTNNDNDTGPVPVVQLVSPSSDTQGVPTNARITVTFDIAMDPATLTTNTANTACSGSFQVSLTATNFASCIQMSAAPVASAGNRTFYIVSSANLSALSQYSVRITTGAQSDLNVPLAAAVTSSFTTASGADTQAPAALWNAYDVLSLPLDNETSVPLNTALSFTFLEAMAPASVTANSTGTGCSGSFQLSTSANNFSQCVQMTGQPLVTEQGKTFMIRPASNLAASTTYLMRITSSATDLAGNAVAQSTITFTTGSATQTASPWITAFTPLDGVTGVSVNTPLQIVGSAPIDLTSVIVNSVSSTCSGNIQLSADNFSTCVPIGGKLNGGANNDYLEFFPAAAMSYSTSYKIRVLSTLKDVYGNNFTPTQHSTAFSTLAATGGATFVQYVQPYDNGAPVATVATNTSISVNFSRVMNPATITVNTTDTTCSGTFQVSSNNFSSCLRMGSDLTASVGNSSFSVHPFSPLAAATQYKVRITISALDASGNPVTAYTGGGFTTW